MFGPFERGNSYHPFLHASYPPERQYFPGYGYSRPQRDPYAEARARAQAEARTRSLAEERARRAQWLPDEDDEDENEDDWRYNQLGPRERAYLDAMKRRQQLERVEQERAEAERRQEEERWQKQLEQRQQEEDARRQRVLEKQRRIQQQRREQARRQTEAANARKPAQHKEPSPQRPPSPPRQPPSVPQYTEKHEEAAMAIQTRYRVHQSLKHIRGVEQTFHDAKQGFVFPTTLDFQRPGASAPDNDCISVQVRSPPSSEGDLTESPMEVDEQEQQPFSGKLAYTSTNYGLHAYVESLLKLLMQLDGVESWGDVNVRKRRRAVVKGIEGEVSRVDAYWKNAWRDHLMGEEEKERQEVENEVAPEGQQEREQADDMQTKVEQQEGERAVDPQTQVEQHEGEKPHDPQTGEERLGEGVRTDEGSITSGP